MGQAKRGNRKSGSGMRWCRTVSMFHRHNVIDFVKRLAIERDRTVRGRILIYASGKEALFFRRISSPSFRRYPEVTPELPVRIIETRIHLPRNLVADKNNCCKKKNFRKLYTCKKSGKPFSSG